MSAQYYVNRHCHGKPRGTYDDNMNPPHLQGFDTWLDMSLFNVNMNYPWVSFNSKVDFVSIEPTQVKLPDRILSGFNITFDRRALSMNKDDYRSYMLINSNTIPVSHLGGLTIFFPESACYVNNLYIDLHLLHISYDQYPPKMGKCWIKFIDTDQDQPVWILIEDAKVSEECITIPKDILSNTHHDHWMKVMFPGPIKIRDNAILLKFNPHNYINNEHKLYINRLSGSYLRRLHPVQSNLSKLDGFDRWIHFNRGWISFNTQRDLIGTCKTLGKTHELTFSPNAISFTPDEFHEPLEIKVSPEKLIRNDDGSISIVISNQELFHVPIGNEIHLDLCSLDDLVQVVTSPSEEYSIHLHV